MNNEEWGVHETPEQWADRHAKDKAIIHLYSDSDRTLMHMLDEENMIAHLGGGLIARATLYYMKKWEVGFFPHAK